MDIFVLILVALLFALVEGISEWLPVSSTGHMILVEEIFASCGKPLSGFFEHGKDFWDMFLVMIQLGAIVAVIVYFWAKLWPFGKKKLTEEELALIETDPKEEERLQKEKRNQIWKTWLKTLIGVIPSGVAGLAMNLLGWDDALMNWAVVSATLIVYGVAFILVEIYKKKSGKAETTTSIAALTYKNAFIIGLFQMLALIPGTSRSGVTILGALLLGCNRGVAAEYSFYLSIPVMIGASLLKFVKFIVKIGMPSSSEWMFLLVGMVGAMLVSFLCVKWLMAFLKKHDFKAFGVYRIVLGIVVIVVFLSIRLASGSALF